MVGFGIAVLDYPANRFSATLIELVDTVGCHLVLTTGGTVADVGCRLEM